MRMASTSSSSMTASHDPYTLGIPYSRATREADSRCWLQTPTTDTPGMARKPGRCRARVMCPAPMMATRISPEPAAIAQVVLSRPGRSPKDGL